MKATERNKSITTMIFMTFLVAVTILSTLSAEARGPKKGGINGGGAPKPPASFGYENFRAILQSPKVKALLGPQYLVLDIKLISKEPYSYIYRINAKSPIDDSKCVIETDVNNHHDVTIPDVQVEEAKVVEGCASANSSGAKNDLENIKPIFESSDVTKVHGLNFSIEEIQFVSSDPTTWSLYLITARSLNGISQCKIEVKIKNALVVEAKALKACVIDREPPKESAVGKYPEEFSKFHKVSFLDNPPYKAYVDIALSIPSEKRKEIIEFMKTSGDEKYYQVFTEKLPVLAQALKQYPDATTHQMYFFIGKDIMGLQIPEQGLVIPVIVGLSYAAIFIAEAQ